MKGLFGEEISGSYMDMLLETLRKDEYGIYLHQDNYAETRRRAVKEGWEIDWSNVDFRDAEFEIIEPKQLPPCKSNQKD